MDVPVPTGGVVLGLGCDLVEVERVRAMHERHGQRLLDRLYTPEEQRYCLEHKNPYPHFAARFAVKEAVSKAFGTGIGKEFGWKSVGIAHNERSAPVAVLDELGATLLAHFGGTEVRVSLSHTTSLAQAVAVIVRAET